MLNVLRNSNSICSNAFRFIHYSIALNLFWEKRNSISLVFFESLRKERTKIDFANFPRNKQRMFLLFCNFVCHLLFIRTLRRQEGEKEGKINKEKERYIIFFRFFANCISLQISLLHTSTSKESYLCSLIQFLLYSY